MSKGSRGFTYSFVKIFVILLVILVILPFVVEYIFSLLGSGITPRGDSVIVFKDIITKQEVITSFIKNIKKILIYM